MPLYKAHLREVWPFLKWCTKKSRPNFKAAMRLIVLDEMGIKHGEEDDDHLEDDPFLMLGYGFNAYFDMLLSFVYMMLTITVFCIPIFMLYKGNSIHELRSSEPNPIKQLLEFTLGNMGAASTFCASKQIKAQKFTAECPQGSIIDYDSLQWGFMDRAMTKNSFCRQGAIDAY